MTPSSSVRSLLSVGFIAIGVIGIVVGATRLPFQQETTAASVDTTPIRWSWLENLNSGYALEYPSGSTISQEESGTLVTLPSGEKITIVASTSTPILITAADSTEPSKMVSEVISHMRASLEPLETATDSASVELERFAGASTREQ